jgi:hypothetical protein
MHARAWCPRCSKYVGGTRGTILRATADASEHSVVSGHATEVWDTRRGRLLRSVAGEPPLPLWEASPSGR